MGETRQQIERGWRAVAETLRDQDAALAERVRWFVNQFKAVQTDNEQLKAALEGRASQRVLHADDRRTSDRAPKM